MSTDQVYLPLTFRDCEFLFACSLDRMRMEMQQQQQHVTSSSDGSIKWELACCHPATKRDDLGLVFIGKRNNLLDPICMHVIHYTNVHIVTYVHTVGEGSG